MYATFGTKEKWGEGRRIVKSIVTKVTRISWVALLSRWVKKQHIACRKKRASKGGTGGQLRRGMNTSRMTSKKCWKIGFGAVFREKRE